MNKALIKQKRGGNKSIEHIKQTNRNKQKHQKTRHKQLPPQSNTSQKITIAKTPQKQNRKKAHKQETETINNNTERNQQPEQEQQ